MPDEMSMEEFMRLVYGLHIALLLERRCQQLERKRTVPNYNFRR